LAVEAQRQLDFDLARLLWEQAELTAAEASFGDIWSFLALVVVPDIVWWRAAGSTNVERFVATELTRHTLARLWWRAHLFTWGLGDPEDGWELWRSSTIGEADLDQIQTRRGGYGRSPKAFRALVRVYPFVIATAADAGVDRRELWRQSYLRWVLRLGAFTNYSGLSEDEISDDLRRLAEELDTTQPPHATGSEGDETTVPIEAEEPRSSDFDDQLLRTIVVLLAEAVRARGSVEETGLYTAVESTTGITIPPEREEIIRGIAWQGKSLGYLNRSDDQGVAVWEPGETLPAEDRRWGEWSISSFTRNVRSRDSEPDERALAAELFRGRPGMTVRRIVRAALREARRQSDDRA
jgi:hypothetical protein